MKSPLASAIASDLESAARLIAARGCELGRPLHWLARTTSTNDEAKRAAKEGAPHGTTWIAEEQSAGRGRQGRVWTSPPGENLLLSVLLRVPCPPARVPPLALVAGLGARDAVARAAPDAAVRIKWPNDVIIEGRKVAGVLVEAMTVGSRTEAVIVGIGVNVHTRAFGPDLADRATSVALVAAQPPDRAAILADLLATLDADLHVVVGRGLGVVRARLDASDALRGRRVRSEGGDGREADEGVAAGIDDEGRLQVRRDDGSLARWIAGEVHLL